MDVPSLYLPCCMWILFHYLFVFLLVYIQNILYIFLQNQLYFLVCVLHTSINIFLLLLHLYMYIGNNFYPLRYYYFYIPLVQTLHPFALFLLCFLVYDILYHVSLMFLLLLAYCNILFFLTLYTMMLLFFYILCLFLIYTIFHLMLYGDFFLSNLLSILFLFLYVL